jgi:hypothetical protein
MHPIHVLQCIDLNGITNWKVARETGPFAGSSHCAKVQCQQFTAIYSKHASEVLLMQICTHMVCTGLLCLDFV